MTDRFNNVMQFLGGYFHQDWPLEAGSTDEVLIRYLGRECDDARLAVVAEIAELLGADDHVLDDTIMTSGFSYDPSVEGMTIRQWLGKAKETLQAPSKQQPTPREAADGEQTATIE